jgi:hypothetical protein
VGGVQARQIVTSLWAKLHQDNSIPSHDADATAFFLITTHGHHEYDEHDLPNAVSGSSLHLEGPKQLDGSVHLAS